MKLRKELHARFDAAVKKAKLARFKDKLLDGACECVHLHYGKPVERLPLGASRVGGTPDLPASIDWPDGSYEGKPRGKAEFLAQFNLADLPDVETGLPHKGHLWIFVQDTSISALPVCVYYRDDSEALKPRKKPADKIPPQGFGWRNLAITPIKMAVGLSLPFSSKAFGRKWQSEPLPFGALMEFQDALGGDLDKYGPRGGIDGQIGGYSYQAEHDICRQIAIEQLGRPKYVYGDAWESVAELEAQIERGSPFGNKEAYRKSLLRKVPQVKWIEKNEAQIAATAASLRLLCMFRPNRSIGLEFGDGMFLDFFIRDSALIERDFDQIHCRLPMLL